MAPHPARSAAMDRACGWNKVAYDAASDTYILQPGWRRATTAGRHLFPARGSPAHPRETLVVHGNVAIRLTGSRRQPGVVVYRVEPSTG